ncbi:MAG: hypothetical protein P8165_17800 [Deltaproteobacteria bacterium]
MERIIIQAFPSPEIYELASALNTLFPECDIEIREPAMEEGVESVPRWMNASTSTNTSGYRFEEYAHTRAAYDEKGIKS